MHQNCKCTEQKAQNMRENHCHSHITRKIVQSSKNYTQFMKSSLYSIKLSTRKQKHNNEE